MIAETRISTTPKPFVFVLMPFDKKFDDIYQLGIKAAADEAGAYAERLDEQIFKEGMLERIYNQISKADVIVADMTGKNANVFYEVGYAHALDKIVILLTQNSDDIPFDLKHHQHIVYQGSIVDLKNELISRIKWAMQQENQKNEVIPFDVKIGDVNLFELSKGKIQEISVDIKPNRLNFILYFTILNISNMQLQPISHIYFTVNKDYYCLESIKKFAIQ